MSSQPAPVIVAAPPPLHREWAFWYDVIEKAPPAPAAATDRHGRRLPPKRLDAKTPPKLTRAGAFNNIITMWQYMNNVRSPAAIERETNIYIFVNQIDPTWEHPANANGGRWLVSIQNAGAADRIWEDLYLALVGETLDDSDEVVGIVAAHRRNYIRLSIWTATRTNDAAILAAGKRFKEIIETHMGRLAPSLEFQDHGAGFDVFRHKIP